jgi:S-formylglutathione hydrolase FrmB
MAFIQMDLYSKMLTRRTEVAVIIPEQEMKREKYPVLWMLHGASGNYSDWWRHTAIELYAEKYGIAVVMPSGENSFYANMPSGRFFDYIAEELPEMLSTMLPLSTKPEQNIVAGLSMGGHGAYKFGLTKPEKYAGIGVFSAGNFIELGDPPAGSPTADLNKLIFGTSETHKLVGTEHDISYLAELAAKSGKQLPQLFACCGTEDMGFETADRTFKYLTQTLGFKGEWRQDRGFHDWYFWGAMLPDFMAWSSRIIEG